MRGKSEALKYRELGERIWRENLEKKSVCARVSVCMKAKVVQSTQVEKKLMNENREAKEDGQRE